MAKGEWPQPVKLSDGGRAIAFSETEIDAWIAARLAAREAA
jgi:prophage regulatory protein